jgi:hypothetical protein
MGSVYTPKDLSKKHKKKISDKSLKDIIPETSDSLDENDKEKEE